MTEDKSSTHLNEDLTSKLQEIQRANTAILGCIQVLIEDGVNKDCMAHKPGVFIRLAAHQKMGLEFAIETCSSEIARAFDDHLEKLGVNWTDEICPEVAAEGEAAADLDSGKISFDEFEQRVNH